MGEKTNIIINSIIHSLQEGPKSISDIAKETELNWRTVEHNLDILKKIKVVMEINCKNARTFLYRDKDNYFDLPIKDEDKKRISTIYANIKKNCLKLYSKEPTKTQVYKILWKLNRLVPTLKLPVGWYKYGPLCIQAYKNNETEEVELDDKIILIIAEVTKEYCIYENRELQTKVYDEANEGLYKAKEKLLGVNPAYKEELNNILMDLIKFSPVETIDVVTDFARATLLAGLDKTRNCFDRLWDYLSLIKIRDSLKEYYPHLDYYIGDRILEAKREAQLLILDLVRSNIRSK